jgi:succinylglutamate desuccinylase
MEQKKRFIKQDMNRMWMPENVARIRAHPPHLLEPEERELRDMVQHIDEELAHSPNAPVVVLDLHTTTADGGIFCIATEDPESVRIASELHAPVILGMLHGIRGTTMHYFRKEVIPRNITSFAFESGQHDDPKSVNRSIAAIIACMRALDMIDPEHVETVHDEVLINYSKGLPRIAELIQAYQIQDEETFEILPDFKNFQSVEKGQLLAHDAGQEIHAIEDGLILMPRYQKQGDDGYFLLRVLVD